MGKFKNKNKNSGPKSVAPVSAKAIDKKGKKKQPGGLMTKDMQKFLSKVSKSNVDSVKLNGSAKGKKVTKAATEPSPKAVKDEKKVDVAKKSKKKSIAVVKGDDFPESMRKELEVFIKNLNRGGEIQSSFVVDDAAVEDVAGDDDVVSVDGNYEDYDDDDDDEQEVEVKVEEEEQEPSKEDAKKEKSKKNKKKEKQEAEKSGKGNFETPAKDRKVEIKDEVKAEIKEEKGSKPELDRADYFFFKEARKERSYCLLKPKSGEPWYEIVNKKSADDDDDDDDDAGIESSSYWLMKIEKFAKKLLDEEVANFSSQVFFLGFSKFFKSLK